MHVQRFPLATRKMKVIWEQRTQLISCLSPSSTCLKDTCTVDGKSMFYLPYIHLVLTHTPYFSFPPITFNYKHVYTKIILTQISDCLFQNLKQIQKPLTSTLSESQRLRLFFTFSPLTCIQLTSMCNLLIITKIKANYNYAAYKQLDLLISQKWST